MVADSAQSPTAQGPSTGEYDTLQELASGGMGSVFLARAVRGPHAGKLVALKRMHPHLERSAQFSAGFFDEAWITAGLKHPNIVDTFDWGTDKSGRYIALEFVAGDSVLNLLKAVRSRGDHMPIDVVLYVIGKTAEALHAAHELRNERGELRHLVHRDVTPSNVLISRDGQVKLIDFGVAKARERLQNNTSTNTLKGKFGYMSPEQARGVKNLDRRSDLWSLGVVLWECLAGRRLFKSESELEILRMVTEDTPASVRSVRPDVPEAVDSLLSAVFAKNRDDRLGSCAEFADYIWAVFREEGYTTDSTKLAEYFRRALPERCASLDRLLAGEDWHLEPTSGGPNSGSFNGTDAHSGIGMAQPRASSNPLSVNYDGPSSSQVIHPASVTAPPVAVQAAPASNKSNLVVIGALAIALLSLGGAGALVMKSRATPAAAQPATSAPSTTPSANTAPTPTTATNTVTGVGTSAANIAPGAALPAANTGVANTNAAPSTSDNSGSRNNAQPRVRARANTGTATTGAATRTATTTGETNVAATRTANGAAPSNTERPSTATVERPTQTVERPSTGNSGNSGNSGSNTNSGNPGTMSTIRGW